MLIGYTRVSTDDQDHGLRLEAFKSAGYARWFSDTASGSVRDRPLPKRALEELRDGEDTLVSSAWTGWGAPGATSSS